MDRDVDLARQHVLFDFLGEKTLAAQGFQRHIGIDQAPVVAGGLDDHDLESAFGQVEGRHQARARFMRLGQCQRRATGADTEGLGGSRQVGRHGFLLHLSTFLDNRLRVDRNVVADNPVCRMTEGQFPCLTRPPPARKSSCVRLRAKQWMCRRSG
jgi:hypothetical protein